jgi:hypothetical protein
VICTGCVLIDIILLKVLLKDNEEKDNISGLSSSLSTFNEMEKQGIILRFFPASNVSTL